MKDYWEEFFWPNEQPKKELPKVTFVRDKKDTKKKKAKKLSAKKSKAPIVVKDDRVSIAIVGNSPVLLNFEMGKEIDSHDIVIRFNNFLIEGYEKLLGKKCTIIAVANGMDGRFGNPKFTNLDKWMELDKSCRFFREDKKNGGALKYVTDGKLTYDDVTMLDRDRYYTGLRDKMKGYKSNHFASTGLMMMQYIADTYPNAKIDAYGFTFFKDDHTHFYDKVLNSFHDSSKESTYFYECLKDKINLRTPIVVNMTTWEKRLKYLYRVLKHFTKQTIRPDKIILWLSEDEYNKSNLPEDILKCVTENLCEVRWVTKNTKCHKRWEFFNDLKNCYNFFIDDDKLYYENFISDMLKKAREYPSSIICLFSKMKTYTGTRIVDKTMAVKHSIKNLMINCWSLVPPSVLPMETFNNLILRDKYCDTCDESWITPLLYKHGIKVYGIHDQISEKQLVNTLAGDIEGTVEDSTWKKLAKKQGNGISERIKQFANAVKIHKCERVVKRLWPDFDLNKCATITKEDLKKIK